MTNKNSAVKFTTPEQARLKELSQDEQDNILILAGIIRAKLKAAHPTVPVSEDSVLQLLRHAGTMLNERANGTYNPENWSTGPIVKKRNGGNNV